MLKRVPGFIFGVLSYGIFLICFVYAIGFIGNFFVPHAIDGDPQVSLSLAIAINAGLLTLFALQHSIMARPAFKRVWVRYIPKLLERSAYTLLSSVALFVLFRFWEPMGGFLWQFESQVARCAFHTVFAIGWGIVLISTFQINHFDLFGLRQAWTYLKGVEYQPLKFETPGFYRYVRHPLYVGWFLVFWATPDMSAAHLFFAVMTTAYILIAVRFEEHDLENELPEYRRYKSRVPRFIPKGPRNLRKPRFAVSH